MSEDSCQSSRCSSPKVLSILSVNYLGWFGPFTPNVVNIFCGDSSRFVHARALARNRLLHAVNGNGPTTVSLDEIFVSHGVPQSAVRERVRSFKGVVSADQLDSALQHDDPQVQWSKLKSLANSCKFRILTSEESKQFHKVNKSTREVSEADPWDKQDPWSSAASGSRANLPSMQSRLPSKPKKSVEVKLRKQDWIDPAGGELNILLPREVKRDAVGVAAMDADSASSLLAGVNTKWSLGALAVVVLGDRCPSLELSAEAITCVATDAQDRLHRVKGWLIQLGDQKVSRQGAADITMNPPTTIEVIVHVSKHFAATELWERLWANPIRTLNQIICESSMAPPEQWFTKRWLPKPTWDAEAFQASCRMPEEDYNKLRVSSGEKAIFLRRKREESVNEAVAWLPEETPLKDALLAQQKHSHIVVGLACVRKRLGLSTNMDHLEGLLADVNPGFSLRPGWQVQCTSTFTLTGLPTDTTAATLRDALKAWGWEVRVINLRPVRGCMQAIVGAANTPPSEQVCINKTLVLIARKNPPSKSRPPAREMFVPQAPTRSNESEDVPMQSVTDRADVLKKDLQDFITNQLTQQNQQTENRIQRIEAEVSQQKNALEAISTTQSQQHAQVLQNIQESSRESQRQFNELFRLLQSGHRPSVERSRSPTAITK